MQEHGSIQAGRNLLQEVTKIGIVSIGHNLPAGASGEAGLAVGLGAVGVAGVVGTGAGAGLGAGASSAFGRVTTISGES